MKQPTPPGTKVSGHNTEAQCRGGRVAFFGGSFDPPHFGHLAVARAARDALRLDRVLFAPVGAQPLKPEGSTATFADRLAMTELAIADEPGFEISLADAPSEAGRPNYTLETLLQLRGGLPAGGCLFCLMGADSFASLRRWRGAAEIPFAASLVVASRPGQSLDDLACCLPQGLKLDSQSPSSHHSDGGTIELLSYFIRNAKGETAPFYVLPGLDVEISASEIRAQLRSSLQEGAASRSVPAPVADYIRSHGLYRQARPATVQCSPSTVTMNPGDAPTRMLTAHTHQQTRILVQAAAAACEDKKGEDIRILELDPVDSGLSDFFLVTSATNDRQAVAIADEVEMRLKRDFGMLPNSVEGRRQGEWILLDYVDFVVHVFLAERRAFYDIERLRKSARPVSPAEFEEELKAALAEKTRSARSKHPVLGGAAPLATPKKAAKKAAAKPAAKKVPAKSAAKKAAHKPAAKKRSSRS